MTTHAPRVKEMLVVPVAGEDEVHQLAVEREATAQEQVAHRDGGVEIVVGPAAVEVDAHG